MRIAGRVPPAILWRALLCLAAVSGVTRSFAAVPAALPELAQVGKPDAQEAARLIEQFRNAGIPGEYYLEFELRSLPRRGEGRTFSGRWWGSRNDEGAITRIELTDAAGVPHRLLLQNGERAAVWRLIDGRPVKIGITELMAPLIPGIEISAFDLQMPYLYWPGVTVEKITRVLSRPAHAFVFPAPAEFKAQYPDISAARAYLDTQFNVPMQTEILGSQGKVTKTWAVLSLKTVDRQTLPKSVDYRNEITRDKTRLQITGAALNVRLSSALFQPVSLAQPAEAPPPDRVVRIDR